VEVSGLNEREAFLRGIETTFDLIYQQEKNAPLGMMSQKRISQTPRVRQKIFGDDGAESRGSHIVRREGWRHHLRESQRRTRASIFQ